MVFIETPIFTKRLRELIYDDDYRKLQLALVLRPEVGKVIPESGGLRKLRWNILGSGKRGGLRLIYSGKRGGLRLIYYWDTPNDTIYMLFIYKKSKQEDLTPEQLKKLRNLVKEWLQ
jgi:mRNA-degrading endonuclease RelE of RelBE toxin-antitoxin system